MAGIISSGRTKVADCSADHNRSEWRVGRFVGQPGPGIIRHVRKNVKFDGASLSFDVPVVHGRYEGKLAEDKNTIRGAWTQGSPLPLDFKRGTAPVAVERPQQPKPPFPYGQEEVRYGGAPGSGATLAGTLTKPEGTGPFPAVLLIPGSGVSILCFI